MCSPRGLSGRLGAAKRRMLSFAEGPPVGLEPLTWDGTEAVDTGVPFVRGAAEGMTASGRQ